MKERQIRRIELARALGVTQSYITQLLSYKESVTLRAYAKIMVALDCDLEVRLVPKEDDEP